MCDGVCVMVCDGGVCVMVRSVCDGEIVCVYDCV